MYVLLNNTKRLLNTITLLDTLGADVMESAGAGQMQVQFVHQTSFLGARLGVRVCACACIVHCAFRLCCL